jgi:hypothetical protein
MKLTKIPQSTIYTTINCIKLKGSVKRRPGSGTSQKLTAIDKKQISNSANSRPKYSCVRIDEMIRMRGSPLVCSGTIWRHLKKSGFMKLLPEPIPILTHRHQENRLKCCRKYRKFNWNNITFTDESYFQMFRQKIRQWGKRRRTVKTSQRCLAAMVWGCISRRGATPLKIETSSVNSQVYTKILRDYLIPSMPMLYPDVLSIRRPHVPKDTKN